MKPKFRNYKGSALITVILVMMVFSIYTGTMLFLHKYSIRKAQKIISYIRAEYLAEAGFYKAVWYLKGNGGKNLFWQPKNHIEKIPGYGSYSFSIKRNGQNYIITATGKSIKPILTEKSIRVTLRFALPPAFDYALYTTEYIEIAAHRISVNGRIASRGNIILLNNLEDRQYNLNPETNIPFPEFENVSYRENIRTFDYFLNNPEVAQKIYNSGQGFNRTHFPDFKRYKSVFVQGRTTIEGGSEIYPFCLSGSGTLISSDLLEIEESVRIKGPLNIIAKQGIIVKGNALLEDVTLYSPQKVQIKDNARVRGLILSKENIRISNNSEILSGSVIYIQGVRKQGRLEGKIIIEKNSVVRGTLICDNIPSLSVTSNRTEIHLYPDSEVYGVIYSRNIADIEGIVYGSVVVRALKNNKWLKGKIDRYALPDNYNLPQTLQPRVNRKFKVYLWERL